MLPRKRNVPDVSPEQRNATELIERIRKLRWIGMEDEAQLVQMELGSCRSVPADSVIAVPRETD